MCETRTETIYFLELESEVLHKIKESPNTYKQGDMTTMKIVFQIHASIVTA
jgi:hypothetical protein